MGATEEQMQLLSDAGFTHVAYVLILYSISFILYLFVNILLHLYAVSTWPDDESNGVRDNRSVSRSASVVPSPRPGPAKRISSVAGMNGNANGSARMPRHRTTDSQQVRDAEEFELEGLISDGDEAPSPKEVERLVPTSEHV
jgi:hypothetical protein